MNTGTVRHPGKSIATRGLALVRHSTLGTPISNVATLI
jgi:hypothetical protein